MTALGKEERPTAALGAGETGGFVREMRLRDRRDRNWREEIFLFFFIFFNYLGKENKILHNKYMLRYKFSSPNLIN